MAVVHAQTPILNLWTLLSACQKLIFGIFLDKFSIDFITKFVELANSVANLAALRIQEPLYSWNPFVITTQYI